MSEDRKCRGTYLDALADLGFEAKLRREAEDRAFEMEKDRDSWKARALASERACEYLEASFVDGPMESYCDVGRPDDCDHCHLVLLLEAWRATREGT